MAKTLPPLNDTQAILLGLLHQGIMNGGQLEREAEMLAPFFSITRSQVYRELPTLQGMGYIRAGKPAARGSQPYGISASGKKAFSRWLDEDPGRGALRNPVAARVFFMWTHSDNQLERIVKSALEYHQAELKKANDLIERVLEDDDTGAAVALHFAVAYHEATLAWLLDIMV